MPQGKKWPFCKASLVFKRSYSKHPGSISAKSESYKNLTASPSVIYSSMKMCKQRGLTTCLRIIPLYYLFITQTFLLCLILPLCFSLHFFLATFFHVYSNYKFWNSMLTRILVHFFSIIIVEIFNVSSLYLLHSVFSLFYFLFFSPLGWQI